MRVVKFSNPLGEVALPTGFNSPTVPALNETRNKTPFHLPPSSKMCCSRGGIADEGAAQEGVLLTMGMLVRGFAVLTNINITISKGERCHPIK